MTLRMRLGRWATVIRRLERRNFDEFLRDSDSDAAEGPALRNEPWKESV